MELVGYFIKLYYLGIRGFTVSVAVWGNSSPRPPCRLGKFVRVWSLLRQLSRLSVNSLSANLTSKPPPSLWVGFNIQVILQDGVRHKDPWVAGYLEILLNTNTCVAPYSTSDKTSFAYISARDRWPVILVSSQIASTSLSADLQELDSRN